MNWGSASAFFEMGGYGLYVWGSYGVAALLMLRRRRAQAIEHARMSAEEEEHQ